MSVAADTLIRDAPSPPPPLPPLRDDLQLLAGPRRADGAPTWTLHDPVRNSFFRLGWAEFEMLGRWGGMTAEVVAERVNRETPLQVTPQQVTALGRFLDLQQLSASNRPQLSGLLLRRALAAEQGPLSWLLHRYLFVRVPLLRPDRFLTVSYPYLRFLFHPAVAVAVVLAALLGLYLVARQWDQFVGSFLYFFSFGGAAYYVLALVFAKLAHEFGHAYTAKHYGLSVPAMGVAFLVMFPVLYTDTTDAWRLQRRRPALAIGAAGIIVELAIAAVATLLWSFLDDGPLRSAVFLLATTTWVMTIAVNLNPFMRFDGYYLLADATGIENLQARAFAYARWWLRERLLGLGEAPPEVVPAGRRVLMLAYAYATWVYRFFLFLGIAVLVYLFFFKALGIFLMLVELAWFIGRPIQSELKAWWDRRRLLRLNHNTVLTGLALAGLAFALLWPWQRELAVPAMLQPAAYTRLFAPQPARLAAVHVASGEAVARGQLLFELEEPDLHDTLVRLELQADVLQTLLEQSLTSGGTADQSQVLEQELVRTLTAIEGVRVRLALLRITAPHDGIVRDLDLDLHQGRWIGEGQPLGLLLDPSAATIRAYVDEQALPRLAVGQAGRFRDEDPVLPDIPSRLSRIERTHTAMLRLPYLASVYGGDVAVRAVGEPVRLVPEVPVYRIVATPEPVRPAPPRMRRGQLRLDAEPESLVRRAWRAAAAVLIRESGF